MDTKRTLWNPEFALLTLLPLLLAVTIALASTFACADQIFTLTLTAGEAYVIHGIDSGAPSVVLNDNSNAFTVKSSGAHDLTVFSFQNGDGTITTKVHGEDVTYHVIVNGAINTSHPLTPGTAPPALGSTASDENADAPAPYAPRTAAVPSGAAPAPVASGPRSDASGISPAAVVSGPRSDASSAEASAHPSTEVAAKSLEGSSGPLPSKASSSAVPSASTADSGAGPVTTSSPSAREEYTSKTDDRAPSFESGVPDPPAKASAAISGSSIASSGAGADAPGTAVRSDGSAGPGTSTTYVGGPAAGEGYRSGNSAPGSTMPPEITRSVGSEWHVQPPLSVNQQFSTNPPAVRTEGYVNNPAFGGRHNLPREGIYITSGTSQVYDFGGPISRVAMANTKVADVQVMGNHQLMVVGHNPGFSSLVVWDQMGNYVERQIWCEIAGHQQVMLHATVCEVSLTKLEQMGADLALALTKIGLSLTSLPGSVASPYPLAAPNGAISPGIYPFQPTGFLPLLLSQNTTYAVSGTNANVATGALFQFLEEHDLGRVLARPQLLANSGEKAKFLAGGEIPIIITQALTSTIVFKQYGTSVVFIPTVVGGRDIELEVRPEVSKPDYTQTVVLNGYAVPSFVTRRAETRVRLRDNQTLIIAGLILDDNRSSLRKVPYLGDVPYLGGFFRHTYWDHEKTELVMSVTPEIVRPLPTGGLVDLPTEQQGPLTPDQVQTRPLSWPDVTRPRF